MTKEEELLNEAEEAEQEEEEEAEKEAEELYYLTCERDWVFFTLAVVSGFYGAYTYLLRGSVFCNAQTGNVVLMGMALGAGHFKAALYYLIPITAYLMGAFFSELLPNPIKRHLPMRWDTLLLGIEMLSVLLLGFVPDSAPVQISQVAINFIASMQYNTFRQAEGVPMATTFMTNHIRQIGVCLAKELKHIGTDNKAHRPRLAKHICMAFCFLGGVAIGTVLCNWIGGKAIWATILPLGLLFGLLLRADITIEKDMVESKPAGH